MRTIRYLTGAILTAGLMACSTDLGIANKNAPNLNNALASPSDVENFIAGSYRIAHQGTVGGQNDDLATQMYVMGLENVSGLANFAMGPRGAIPRNPIDNQRGSQGNIGNDFDFTVEHRAARVAMLGLERMQTLSLGSLARNARATAFARFAQGVALGNLALAYDSAMIVTENNNHTPIIPFSGYLAVDSAALRYLDSAIAIASAPAPAGPTSDWFPLPNTWLNGVAVSSAQFIQLCRSYKARIRAGVARTPTERATQVDWASVIADANAGITADFNITMSPSTGWDVQWPVQAYATGSANWHQMSQFILGMADSSGQYDAWLATPRNNRVAFTVYTADKRFPSGNTRALQQADTNVKGLFTGGTYLRNRPSGEDQPGDPFGISQYDFYRSRAFYLANRIGNYPIMAKAEMDLLAAEGYLRQGDVASAVTKINSSRTGKGKLPSLSAITDTLTAVPGGAACVPRVPDPATTFTSAKCGNVWDALRWEYWMETAYIGYGQWYIANRGWGALPEGTAIQWPVPYNEMDVRGEAFYSMGGVGAPGGAAAGIYGLHAGGAY